MSLNVEWISNPKRWNDFRDSWNQTLSQSERPSIFTSWDFLQASWTHFALSYGSRMAILRLFDSSGDVGFAPMRISQSRRYGMPLRRLTHLAQWECDRAPFIFAAGREEECSAAFWNALEDRIDDWDQLELNEFSPDDALVRQTVARCASLKTFSVTNNQCSPSVFLTFPDDWENLSASFGSSHRQNVRRRLRQLERKGSYEFEVFEEPETMSKALEYFVRIEQESWKSESGQGIGKDHRHIQFYRDILERLSPRGEVTVSFINQGGVRLSALMEYRFGGDIIMSQTAFLKTHESASPGLVHMALSLKRHLEDGARQYEFEAKFLHHKKRWSKRLHENVRLRIVQNRWLKHRILFPRASLGALRGAPSRWQRVANNG